MHEFEILSLGEMKKNYKNLNRTIQTANPNAAYFQEN